MNKASEKPDYGIDAPGVVRTLLLIGIGLLLTAYFLPILRIGQVVFRFRPMALATGTVCFLEGALMIVYSKYGKFRQCDRMLGMASWKGGETVLDVGTGRGLLMIGAAKRLTSGRATGIDIWSGKDLSGNSKDETLRNAELEGVRARVSVEDGDATAMRFPDNSFDVALSNLCLHNIPTAEGREKACREILRVLKPGGTALVSDFKNTADYEKCFRAAGAIASRTGMDLFNTFPPLRIVQVEKPVRPRSDAEHKVVDQSSGSDKRRDGQ